MASGLMSRYAEQMRQVVIGEVLKAIGLLPQLYEQFLATDDQTMVSLPDKNYCRVVSLPLLTYVSEFYEAFLRNTSAKRSCAVCDNKHSRNQLCLPDLFEPVGLDLLFDILERKRFSLSSRDDLVSLVKICGYLRIKSEILHAFLLNLLSLNEVSTWESGTAFVYELYWNGYLESVAYYARSVDHPDFLSLLKANESYRKVKKQLRSYHRYREFARTFTYPSGRVKFSKVRAAFFWDYYSAPSMQPDDYPEYGW